MTNYDALDNRILQAIQQRKSPLYDRFCNAEAEIIKGDTDREVFRIIDGRLQALKRAGKIRFYTKAAKNGQGGWHIEPTKAISGL